MATFKVTLNWFGEIHTIYTTTDGELRARRNALYQLANKLGKDLSFIQRHFWTGDKILIKRED